MSKYYKAYNTLKNIITGGNKNPVKGSGAARKQKDITWY